MDNSDYTFEVSLTTKAFDHKPNKLTEVPKLRFETTTTDIGSFAAAIADGHGYAPIFDTTAFGMGEKVKDNFMYSFFVSLDVDDTMTEMDTFVKGLQYKPTLAYTSCSNEPDNYRYRLIYCFNEKIEGVDEYYSFVYAILAANGLSINDVDASCRQAERYYNGNCCSNINMSIPGIVYSKADFNKYYTPRVRASKVFIKNNIYTTYNICLDDTFENEEFKKNYWSLPITELLEKYIEVYPNFEHTPLPPVDDDTPYIVFPEGYIEIERAWSKSNDGKAVKIADGHGRRNKLYVNGVLRRLINPAITFDNLLYNLIFELQHYITNYKAQNIIGKKEVYEIAVNVMKADLSKIEVKPCKRKFMVNEAYCNKYGLKANAVKNTVGKTLRWELIGSMYDCSLSDKENVAVMKEHGLKVSLRTLQNWKSENNITRRNTCCNKTCSITR